MSAARAQHGDIVRVNKKGRRFHAHVLKRDGVNFNLLPIEPNITWLHCTSHEIEAVWYDPRRFGGKKTP